MAYKKFGHTIERIVEVTSAGGTTTLLYNSPSTQRLIGTNTETFVLPDATTLVVGQRFTIANRSTEAAVVNFNGGSLAANLPAGSQRTFRVDDNSTSIGSWDITEEAGGGAASLTTEQKLGVIAALSTQNYEDAESISSLVELHPEELGGDYWRTRKSLSTVRRLVGAFSLNGQAYSTGGNGVADARVDTVERFNSDSNYFLSRQSLPTVRSFHTAFAFDKGYVAGGFDASVRIDTTYSYDDSTNAWTLEGAFSLGVRSGFSSAIVDGAAIMTGGYNGSAMLTIEAFYPDLGTWHARASLPTAKLNEPSLASDREVYAVGGEDPSLAAAVFAFNQATNSWRVGPQLPIQRSNGPAFSTLGVGYAVGGSTGVATPNTTNYQLDFEAQVWKTLSPKTTPTYDNYGAGTATLGYGHILGGNDNTGANLSVVETYVGFVFVSLLLKKVLGTTPASIFTGAAVGKYITNLPIQVRSDGDSWKTTEANEEFAVTPDEAIAGKVKTVGVPHLGLGLITSSGLVTAENRAYDPIVDAFLSRASYGTARAQAFHFPLLGKSYAIGGTTDTINTDVNEEFNHELNSYANKAVLPNPGRIGAQFDLADGHGYTAGGEYDAATQADFTRQYNATTNAWSLKASLPTARRTLNGCEASDRGYALGGRTPTIVNTVESYIYVTNAWLTRTGMNTARAWLTSWSIAGIPYAMLGNNGADLASTEQYNDQTNAWTNKANNPQARLSAIGVRTNGYGWAMQGSNSSTNIHQYNAESNTWATKTATSFNARTDGIGHLPGAQRKYELRVGIPIYLAALGGVVWTTSFNTTVFPVNASGAVAVQGSIFRLGGFNGGGVADKRCEEYDEETDSCKQTASMGTDRYNLGSFGLQGFAYAYQGVANPSGMLSSAERFNPSTKTWATLPDTGAAQTDTAQGAPLNGYGYAVGGGGDLRVVQWNPSTHAWAAKVNNPQAHLYFTASVNGHIYITAGTNTYRYNDANDSWSASIATLNTSVNSNSALVIRGAAYSIHNTACEKLDDSAGIWKVVPTITTNGNSGGHATLSKGGYVLGGGSNSQTIQRLNESASNVLLGAGLRVS